MFHLKPADGAIGDSSSVKAAYGDFKQLALKIAQSVYLRETI